MSGARFLLHRFGNESGNYDGKQAKIEQVSVERASEKISDKAQFADVRNAAEHANGHAAQTINLPPNHLSKELDRLDPDKPTYVICAGGYRSSLGTSILENAGFKEIYNIGGGTTAWENAGLPIEK